MDFQNTTVEIKVNNMEELQQLITKATTLNNQLKETLKEIENFKISVNSKVI